MGIIILTPRPQMGKKCDFSLKLRMRSWDGVCWRSLGSAGAGTHAGSCKASAAEPSAPSSAWVEREGRRLTLRHKRKSKKSNVCQKET